MSNFCAKCGAHLDSRGLCPSCNPVNGIPTSQNLYSGQENQQPVYNQDYGQTTPDKGYSQNTYNQGYAQSAYNQGYDQNTYNQGYDQNTYNQGYDQNAYNQGYDQNAYNQGYDQNPYNQGYDQNANDPGYGQVSEPAPVVKKSKAPVVILVIILVLLLAVASVFLLWKFDIVDLPIPGMNDEKTEAVEKDDKKDEPESEDEEDTEPSTEDKTEPSTQAPVTQPEESDSFIGTDINNIPSLKPDMKSKYENGVLSYSDGHLSLYADTEGRISRITVEEGSENYCLFGIRNSMSISEAANILSSKGYSEADSSYSVMKRYISAAGEEVILWNDGSGNVSKIEYSLSSEPDEPDEPDEPGSDNYDINSPITAFNHAFASSTLYDMVVDGVRYNYGASNLIDNDTDTCWAEGDQGNGTGEEINITSDTSERVHGICIYNGYAKNASVYSDNNRGKEITIFFDDGSFETATLTDGFANSKNVIIFDNPVDTKSIRVRFDSIYFANNYSDLCISEIYAF